MDIANKFEQICIFFADDGFITVLEQVAGTFMTEVKGDCVTGKEPFHEPGKRDVFGAQQQMEMIGHKRPGKTLSAGRFELSGKAPDKIEAVIITKKDIALFYTTYDDVLKDIGNVNSSRAGHGKAVTERMMLVKFSRTSPCGPPKRDGKGYQTRLNAILRREMEKSGRKAA